ncbi:LysE family translocator [Streptomyces sp. R302]|uniref:LysE family translocator n=1 Tax=unclassified Streptomyces TaxID=2593676 RepID=UPI00145D1B87|nr:MULTISPECIES: LysE family translocator [unclassified Streptomyces]NML50655.1 LysE family translocator [Streptomyces sp. R301]NML80750.1 LysE family translocator [Streptomyces sp. R302]
MASSTAFWSFALVVGLLTLTPGLDTALILRTAALGRRTRAWGVVLGIQTGTLIWGALTSLGVTALLTASHLAYEILRWAGAAYLLWMAGRMIAETFRRRGADASAEVEVGGADTLTGGWHQGTLTNLLNPKVGVFYVAVLPQFIPAEAPHFAMGLALTSVHVVLGVVWSTVLIASASALGTWLRGARARRVLDRVTGTVIGAFAVRLAVSD